MLMVSLRSNNFESVCASIVCLGYCCFFAVFLSFFVNTWPHLLYIRAMVLAKIKSPGGHVPPGSVETSMIVTNIM